MLLFKWMLLMGSQKKLIKKLIVIDLRGIIWREFLEGQVKNSCGFKCNYRKRNKLSKYEECRNMER